MVSYCIIRFFRWTPAGADHACVPVFVAVLGELDFFARPRIASFALWGHPLQIGCAARVKSRLHLVGDSSRGRFVTVPGP